MKIKNVNIEALKKVLKKGIVIGTLCAATLSLSACSSDIEKFEKTLIKTGVEISDKAEYGSLLEENSSVNFSLARCGNNQETMKNSAKKLLKDKTVPTGIIIESEAATLAEICKDIDYAKELVSKYKVEYPVCLDVDKLFSNSDNSTGDVVVIVQTFINKLQENGCFVKIIGSKQNIDLLAESLDITFGLKLTEETKELSDDYDLIIGEEFIYSDKNYKDLIQEGNLNNEDLFVGDYVHIVEAGDTLIGLSDKYNISVNNIKLYNNLESDNIKIGQELVIPTIYGIEQTKKVKSDTTTTELELVDTDKFYKGIDVSKYQENVNWDLLAKKIDFAIIRLGDAANKDANGNYELDEYFVQNIEACNRLGIPVGVYYYSRATTEEENATEIKFVLENIKQYNITLPVYRDLEGSYAEMLNQGEESRMLQVNLTEQFCSTVEGSGYASGIYLHKKYLNKVSEINGKYSIWAQGGWYYANSDNFDSMHYAYEEENGALTPFNMTYGVNIFQPTENGSVASLGSDANGNPLISGSQAVDFNYVAQDFVDALIEKFDKKGNVKVLEQRNR